MSQRSFSIEWEERGCNYCPNGRDRNTWARKEHAGPQSAGQPGKAVRVDISSFFAGLANKTARVA
jgi:hypothetical protein